MTIIILLLNIYNMIPSKTFYKIREVEAELTYASYLDQQQESADEIIKQLEVVKRDIDNLLNNIKENE